MVSDLQHEGMAGGIHLYVILYHKITNRGFAKGPFCPIYGFGALTVFFILRPYSDNSILLFFLGSFLATTLEFLTALVMKRIFR